MRDMGEGACPFEFNFDPASFKVGDEVSYRVEGMDDFPFAGRLVAVHDDHVVIVTDPKDPPMRGTRESRPFVLASEIA